MMKSLLKFLFSSEENKGERNSNYNQENQFKLEKGKIVSVVVPDIGVKGEIKLLKNRFKTGDIVRSGNIICELEIGENLMEVEVFHEGKLTIIRKPGEKLSIDSEIFRVEGI